MGHGGDFLEPGLVEQAVEFVRRNVETVKLKDGVRREERWDYPREAVREAVVNAVAHRDYLLSGTDVELSVYSDRLEVVSPGRLTNGVTPARMRAGCRSARNELLKDVMRDYGYLEHMGMGVPRKIVRGMREAQRHRTGSGGGRRTVHRPIVESGAGWPAVIERRSSRHRRLVAGGGGERPCVRFPRFHDRHLSGHGPAEFPTIRGGGGGQGDGAEAVDGRRRLMSILK